MTILIGLRTIIVGLFVCLGMTGAAYARAFQTLVNFDGNNGAGPFLASLVQGPDGSIYGTTEHGSANGAGYGTIFKMTARGRLMTLYSFASTDGAYPYAGLLFATDGSFYGTTYGGGGNGNCPADGGCGTIFKITPLGKLTTLHIFHRADGAALYSRLIQGTDDRFYGAASQGGAHLAGALFKITSRGTLTTIYDFCSFTNCTDGTGPQGNLILGSDGNFYGTTFAGGASDCACGTVFKITPEGALTTLHSFGMTDGAFPIGGVVQGSDGDFYGTTNNGGEQGYGTIFKITQSGSLTVLHSFIGPDGEYPCADLVQATDGSFYGTTPSGGDGGGTIFNILSNGMLNTLHTFFNLDGFQAFGGLLQATDGNFYGTTYEGGSSNAGVIFKLSTGLRPFISLVSVVGRVGQTGGILGQGFTGTTSVLLNGAPTPFTVVSDTFIKATIPAGATTGFVTVATPTGTLTSNVPFRVLP